MKRISIALLLTVIMVTTQIIASEDSDATDTILPSWGHRHHRQPNRWNGDGYSYGVVGAAEDTAEGGVEVAAEAADDAVDIASGTVQSILGQ